MLKEDLANHEHVHDDVNVGLHSVSMRPVSNIGGNDLNTSTCPANALNSKEQHLGLCGIQKVAHQRHQTKGRTISSDIYSIQESVAMAPLIQVSIIADSKTMANNKPKAGVMCRERTLFANHIRRTMTYNKPKADVMCRGSPLFSNHIRTDEKAATICIHPTNALLNDPFGNCEAVNPIGLRSLSALYFVTFWRKLDYCHCHS
ncbi:hypothetical protein Tco_1351698 [Tanacetum coccineum]